VVNGMLLLLSKFIIIRKKFEYQMFKISNDKEVKIG